VGGVNWVVAPEKKGWSELNNNNNNNNPGTQKCDKERSREDYKI
jgi:hypothetical protein